MLDASEVESSVYSRENKSVALALLTDYFEDCCAHMREEGVEIKYTVKQNPDGAHDGFVTIDPESYLPKFEMPRPL